MESVGVLLVAGGSGTRMGSNIPKQFIICQNKPIIQLTIERFFNWNPTIKLVLVLPENQIESWKNTTKSKGYTINYQICKGGKERFDSVKNGLSFLDTNIIMVHDGVRPFVNNNTLDRCLEKAREKGSAIPVIKPVESMRQIINVDESNAVNREDFRLVQTPQCFKQEWIKKAYIQDFTPFFTDDASVVEKAGYPIFLVDGSRENIKITTPFDLQLSDFIIKFQTN